MKFCYLLTGTFFLCMLLGCGGSSPGAAINGPEETLRQYQYFVDNNLFTEAKRISTIKEQKRLNEVVAIITEDIQESTKYSSVFHEINCTNDNKVAYCDCLIEDEFEKYRAEYKLVRLGGQWLVDAPDEEIIIRHEIMEEMLENMEDDIR